MQGSDDEEGSEEGSGADDEGAAAATVARRRGRSKKAGRAARAWLRCSPATALVAIIVLMVSAQVFVLLDQLFSARR